jgi:putative flippase GtrA
MIKFLDSIELFFSRFVPGKLKRIYHIGFRYGVFVFGGFIGYVLYYLSQRILYDMGLWRGFGLGVGLILAIAFTFTYHTFITFDQKSGWKDRLIKFVPVQLLISVINWIASMVAIEMMHFQDLPATFLITLVLSLLNFVTTRLLVFRGNNNEKHP